MRLTLFVALLAATPAPLPDLPHGQCELQVSGADSYFLGDFTTADGKVSGTERWVLYANPVWKTHEGRDCTVTWTVSGTTATPGTACKGCDAAIQFHAEVDKTNSNCPDALMYGRTSPTGKPVGGEAVPFDQKYDLKTGADGTVTVYFGASGKLLGTGHSSAGHLDYQSGHQCKFF